MKIKLHIVYTLGEMRFEDEVRGECFTAGDVEKKFYTLHRKHKNIREILMREIEERKK